MDYILSVGNGSMTIGNMSVVHGACKHGDMAHGLLYPLEDLAREGAGHPDQPYPKSAFVGVRFGSK